MKKYRSLFILVTFFAIFLALNAPCLSDDGDERQVLGNYGVDFYAYAAMNSGLIKMDYVYIPGLIYRWDLRSLGWPQAYLSDTMDIFLFSDTSTIVCYYRADGHCCTAVFLGDVVK